MFIHISSSCSSIPLPLIPFTIEEITDCSKEVPKGANKAQKNPNYLFILCFTVSVVPSINTAEFSNDFIIVIISFTSLFEI